MSWEIMLSKGISFGPDYISEPIILTKDGEFLVEFDVLVDDYPNLESGVFHVAVIMNHDIGIYQHTDSVYLEVVTSGELMRIRIYGFDFCKRPKA
jgi:hypothetical protein